MSIFPYIYYMILSFNVTSEERQISIYVGLVTSAFAFAEFSTGVVWGRLSDRVGRKPVLLTGLAGTCLSMLVFGFAPNLPIALLGRALGGLLNGNIGVLQTTVAEIVTVKEHQPRAYSIMPFVWSLGSILGPALGGALAQPCINYPSIFSRGTLFDRYPFLLPNLVCAAILAVGVLVGILFLEETHELMKHRRDWGLECGKWILSRCSKPSSTNTFDKAGDANMEESRSLLEDDQPPGYQTTEGSPRDPSSRSQSPSTAHPKVVFKHEGPTRTLSGVHLTFTKQVILNIAGYGILAYHTMSFDQMMPVFLSTPVSHEPPSLPFQFTGGFALSSKKIGLMLSFQGVYSMLAQLFLFPFIVRRFGTLKTYRFVVMSWPMLYFLTPYLVLLPVRFQMTGVCVCLVWRITSQILAFPSNAILLTNSAPSLLVLGVINGIAASTASMSRALGPTLSGFVHSWGLKMGCTGLVWWAAGLICILGAIESMWVDEGSGRMNPHTAEDEEVGIADPLIKSSAMEVAIAAVDGPTQGPSGSPLGSLTPRAPAYCAGSAQ
ncbi:hypothetical protein MMC29_003856 [Sticta canariensis]|nr:hypothetical protein [Sticta canariensis]